MKATPRQWLLFALTVVVMLSLRLYSYQPLDLSVSNFDTQEFIKAGRLPFFSADFFTSGRPATIALIYKLAEPPGGYAVTNLSSPGDFINPPLAAQPGLGAVSSAQGWLSIYSWLTLAFVVFRQLQYPLARLLGPALVLLFGFSPQTAEWDYVLMSEPISLSLFVLLLALSLELSAQLALVKRKIVPAAWTLLAAWLLTLAAWLFARDSNAYFVLVLLPVLALALAFHRRLKLALPARLLAGLLILLAALFYVQNHTAQLSGRWINPFFNNLLAHVFPVSEHLAFFEQRGLPTTDEVLALRNSPFTQLAFFDIDYLVAWTKENGARTFVEFILTHPSWALNTVAEGTLGSYSENTQPFFVRDTETTPDWLVRTGNLFHPTHISSLAIVALGLALIAAFAFTGQDARRKALAACLLVFFAGELAVLAVSILGDAAGIVRHTIGSLVPLRLSVWLLLAFVLDFGLPRPDVSAKAR